jgi:probable phosphoglycerate mutase
MSELPPSLLGDVRTPVRQAGFDLAGLQTLTLYVVRHGQCEHNVGHLVAGQNDSPLTALGREQALANGKRLARLAGRLDTLDFYCSPLHRTATTMELMRQTAGLAVTGYVADRRLMELDLGENTGRAWRDIAADIAEDPLWQNGAWDYRHPGGESLGMLYARVAGFLKTLRRDALIVGHAGTVRMIRAFMLGLSKEDTMAYHPLNAGVLRLANRDEQFFGD